MADTVRSSHMRHTMTRHVAAGAITLSPSVVNLVAERISSNYPYSPSNPYQIDSPYDLVLPGAVDLNQLTYTGAVQWRVHVEFRGDFVSRDAAQMQLLLDGQPYTGMVDVVSDLLLDPGTWPGGIAPRGILTVRVAGSYHRPGHPNAKLYVVEVFAEVTRRT